MTCYCRGGTWLHILLQNVSDNPWLSCAGVMGPPQSFKVVWPTIAEVKNSIEGWFAGVSVPGPAVSATHARSSRVVAMLTLTEQMWSSCFVLKQN